MNKWLNYIEIIIWFSEWASDNKKALYLYILEQRLQREDEIVNFEIGYKSFKPLILCSWFMEERKQ